MAGYQNILVGIDLSKESELVVAKAAGLAALYQAKLSLVHVIEPLSFAYGGDLPLDFSGLQDDIQKQAKEQMVRIGTAWSIPTDSQFLVIGKPEREIQQTADTLGADLIVIGSHGRHGLALLLGSTASGVLHGVKCDVLAVKV